MSKEIEHIRDWVRTNGEMSEDGKSITYDCKDIEEVIEQALNMRIVSRSCTDKEAYAFKEGYELGCKETANDLCGRI